MFQRWKERGFLKSRVCMALGLEGYKEYQNHPFQTRIDENQLTLKGVKIILHETTGQLSPTQEELNEMVLDIHRSGLQAVLHAIEEKTIEAACTAIEYALKKFPRSDHRHRIEHCSVCTPSLAKRFASLGNHGGHPAFFHLLQWRAVSQNCSRTEFETFIPPIDPHKEWR